MKWSHDYITEVGIPLMTTLFNCHYFCIEVYRVETDTRHFLQYVTTLAIINYINIVIELFFV